MQFTFHFFAHTHIYIYVDINFGKTRRSQAYLEPRSSFGDARGVFATPGFDEAQHVPLPTAFCGHVRV